MQNVEMLRDAGRKRVAVDMTYKKKLKKNQMAAEVKSYMGLEVYKIAGDRLWAYDPNSGKTKQFIMHPDDPESGVLYVKLTEKKYEPRWDIEV